MSHTATPTPCSQSVWVLSVRTPTRNNTKAKSALTRQRRKARRTSPAAATICRAFTARSVLLPHRLFASPGRLITFHPQISSIQDDLRTYNDNVSRISDLHNRSLNNTDDAAAERFTQQLEELVAETSALSNVLKRRIKALERQPGGGRDGQIRKQQVCLS